MDYLIRLVMAIGTKRLMRNARVLQEMMIFKFLESLKQEQIHIKEQVWSLYHLPSLSLTENADTVQSHGMCWVMFQI